MAVLESPTKRSYCIITKLLKKDREPIESVASRMKLMAAFLRCLAYVFRLFPLQRKVAFLSRQSSRPSLDYRLLIAALEARNPNCRIIVCVSEPETKSKASFVLGTMKQLYHASTAKVCVVDGYVPAVSIPAKREGATVVQLWHALGAVKRFGYQSLDTPAGRTSEAARVCRMHRNYDYVVAGGPGAVAAFAEAFDCPEQTIVPIGLPRLDYLLDQSEGSARLDRARDIERAYPFLQNGKPTVLYAPTLRRGCDRGWLVQNVSELASCVSDEIDLVVTGHPLDCCSDGFDEARYPFVKFVEGVATIDLLELVDCVITDYSAVAFEAGRLKRSVYFYVPDIEEYRSSPGLSIDPLSEFPDCAAPSARELMGDMVLPALFGSREVPNDFLAFEETYFEGVDAGSCDRIADLLESALEASRQKEQ